MALSFPYRAEPHAPYWGPVTSQANFCEQDYAITSYIAEVVNTLTNLTYLIYAYHGIKNNVNRKDAILRNLPYLGIAGVGIGSAIFHSTLKNYTQWFDDLSMLLATSAVLHRVFTFNTTLSTTLGVGAWIASTIALFSIWHCMTDEIIMHSILFAIMIALVGIKTRLVIAERVKDEVVKREVRKLCTWGGVIFISGFGIWNLDNIYCSSLTQTKRAIGMPWSFFLELHGWWHIFTGVGAYIFIALVEYLTSEEAGQPLGRSFAWPVGLIIDGTAGTKSANGSAKMNGNANGKIPNGNGKVAYGNGFANGNGHANGKVMNGKIANGNGNVKKDL